MAGKSGTPMSKKILLLEDELTLANLYYKKLSEAGHEVMLCTEAQELLDSYKDFNPDAAILDNTLKGDVKSGMDLIPVLKKSNPEIKIAMLSNHSEFHMEAAARKAGANDYLLKINMSPKQLVDYVERLFA